MSCLSELCFLWCPNVRNGLIGARDRALHAADRRAERLAQWFEGNGGQWLLLGLDSAGKTSLRESWSGGGGEEASYRPTTRWEFTTFLRTKRQRAGRGLAQLRGSMRSYPGENLWECGGAEQHRRYWNYYRHTLDDILFWVVNANERHRLQESRFELHRLLKTDRERKEQFGAQFDNTPIIIVLNEFPLGDDGDQNSNSRRVTLNECRKFFSSEMEDPGGTGTGAAVERIVGRQLPLRSATLIWRFLFASRQDTVGREDYRQTVCEGRRFEFVSLDVKNRRSARQLANRGARIAWLQAHMPNMPAGFL